MQPEDNFDRNLEDIFETLGNLVGEGEIEARRILGDEQYEKTVSLMEKNNAILLKKEETQVRYLEVLISLQACLAFSILFACAMGLSWSLFYWFS